MLVARPPFEAETLPELCEQVLTAPPPRLGELRPEIPADLEAAVHRCLEREPVHRWHDVAALVAALTPFQVRSLTAPIEVSSDREMASTLVMGRSEDPLDTGLAGAPAARSGRKLALGVLIAALLTGAGVIALSSVGNENASSASHATHRIESASTDPAAPGGTSGGATKPEPREGPNTATEPLVNAKASRSTATTTRVETTARTRVEPVVDAEQPKARPLRLPGRAPARPTLDEPGSGTSESRDALPDFGGRR
jgi:hypothetical protein